MQHPEELSINDFDYQLTEDRIALHPEKERDAAKLLVYKDGIITDDVYSNIHQHLPPQTLLVFNRTKVIKARLLFTKESGGTIEVFCLNPHAGNAHNSLQQKGTVVWECLVGGAAKWKHGTVLTRKHEGFTLTVKIIGRTDNYFLVELAWDNEDLTFAQILNIAGKVPLPPYLHRETEDEDANRYQTIFAANEGSVAAPTAALHFTDAIFKSLEEKEIKKTFVTLHVGAGTFKPVKAATMHGHQMHAEWMEVERKTIETLIENLNNIVAVGTTSLRVIESLYEIGYKLHYNLPIDLNNVAVSQWEVYNEHQHLTTLDALHAIIKWMEHDKQEKIITQTQILIAPGYQFKIAKGLITNFHQPKSTLLLLVAALIGDDWKAVYNHALANNYRFLSYGDGSLLWKKD